MKITIAGSGYVGLVASVCFAEVGHQVTCVDMDVNRVKELQNGIVPIYEDGLEELMHKNAKAGRLFYTANGPSAYRQADAIFICVGTPEMPDGSANLNYIAAAARQIAESVERDCLVVVKSTVPVGTNDKVEQFIHDFLVHDVTVEVASNPEFLAQGSAVHDTLHAARIVIGVNSPTAEATLRAIYEPFHLPIVSVDRRSAEMIKYACNAFLALKISYMNEIANLCENVGADIQAVSRGMSYDARIGAKFLNAGIGYGGSCFPKDTKALKWLAAQHHSKIKTVEAAIEVNASQKTLLFRKASERLITFHGLKIAVLGLTFKPGTNDLREAPALDNIALLLKAGAEVYAYDPEGQGACSKFFPEGKIGEGSVTYCKTPEECITDAAACFIFTEWPQIAALPPHCYKKFMRTPLVFDGRNIYKCEEMAIWGVEYYSIGRSRFIKR